MVSPVLENTPNARNAARLERHRLQHFVASNLLKNFNVAEMKMLHFAPENFFRRTFSKLFGRYETAGPVHERREPQR